MDLSHKASFVDYKVIFRPKRKSFFPKCQPQSVHVEQKVECFVTHFPQVHKQRQSPLLDDVGKTGSEGLSSFAILKTNKNFSMRLMAAVLST